MSQILSCTLNFAFSKAFLNNPPAMLSSNGDSCRSITPFWKVYPDHIFLIWGAALLAKSFPGAIFLSSALQHTQNQYSFPKREDMDAQHFVVLTLFYYFLLIRHISTTNRNAFQCVEIGVARVPCVFFLPCWTPVQCPYNLRTCGARPVRSNPQNRKDGILYAYHEVNQVFR